LRTIVRGFDYVIHAAALKIVPVAEVNVREVISTNVDGTRNVAIAATEGGCKKVVLVSSDKSCGPTYYGVTKRLGEGLFREANSWGNTQFVATRYGNVLKSAKSIVPFFQRQIVEDTPFTVTNFQMTRFWLSMKQATDLIVQVATQVDEGAILVPKAPMMSVVDLAKTLDPDREMVEIGIRPGERLHETLVLREEALHTLEFDTHFIIYPPRTHVDSNVPFQFEYTSDIARQLTADEMKDLLDES
jgi:UDP-N-acetylglucosamine 4,6-dehydratase